MAFGICLGWAAVAAVANWMTRTRDLPRLQAVSKVLVTSLLVVAAVVGPARPQGVRWWFVGALVACLVGDVALLDQVDRFIGGLVAFLIGHVAFGVGGLVIGVTADRLIATLVVLTAVLGMVAPRIVRSSGSLAAAVVAYLVVISAMAVVMALTGRSWLTFGAVMFVASDSVLAWNRFVRPLRWGPLAVMVTYHAALAGLVVGMGR